MTIKIKGWKFFAEDKGVPGFDEACPGYNKRAAFEEARRCAQCPDPVCQKACPLGVDVPGFIRQLREGQVNGALDKIKEKNPLPGVCGRVCRAPCEQACIVQTDGTPVAVRALERYAADRGRWNLSVFKRHQRDGKRVAVVGSGPAGLTAAAELARRDYQVSVFDAFPQPGGILRFGVADFRLPEKVLDGQIQDLLRLGVQFEMSSFAGPEISLKDLFSRGFHAVLLAVGQGGPLLNVFAGAHLTGVFFASEVLLQANIHAGRFLSKKTKLCLGKKVVVVGNNEAALDCARACVRLGSEAVLVSERTEEELVGYAAERKAALKEGVLFEALVRVVDVVGDQKRQVTGLNCVRMDYADPDSSGQWQLVPVPGSEFELPADTVILALEHGVNTQLRDAAPELFLKRSPALKVDPRTKKSPLPGVFVAGAAAGAEFHIVAAMASGQQAAAAIDRFLEMEG